MNQSRRRSPASSIHVLAPILLFCLFAAGAILVILFGARIYASTVQNSSRRYEARTTIAYVTEKVHRSDAAGSVRVGTFDGLPALILSESTADDAAGESAADPDHTAGESAIESDDLQTTSEQSVGSGNLRASSDESAAVNSAQKPEIFTFIYAYNGHLYELTASSDSGASAESGTPILEIQDFKIEVENGNLLHISCTDTGGKDAEAVVALRSGEVSA